MKLGLL
jgi:hypothetical protein